MDKQDEFSALASARAERPLRSGMASPDRPRRGLARVGMPIPESCRGTSEPQPRIAEPPISPLIKSAPSDSLVP